MSSSLAKSEAGLHFSTNSNSGKRLSNSAQVALPPKIVTGTTAKNPALKTAALASLASARLAESAKFTKSQAASGNHSRALSPVNEPYKMTSPTASAMKRAPSSAASPTPVTKPSSMSSSPISPDNSYNAGQPGSPPAKRTQSSTPAAYNPYATRASTARMSITTPAGLGLSQSAAVSPAAARPSIAASPYGIGSPVMRPSLAAPYLRGDTSSLDSLRQLLTGIINPLLN
jgi:hypothetical protein